MRNAVKHFLVTAAVVVVSACDSQALTTRAGGADTDDAGSALSAAVDAGRGRDAGEAAGDHALIVPVGLTVTALAGGNGVLELFALTLREGPRNVELYAGLRNVGDVPACDAAVSVELFDERGRSLAAGIGGLLTQHFYRRTDGSGTIAACVGPGELSMTAVTDLPSDVAIEDVAHVVYRCPYFALDVMPIDGLRISPIERVATGDGTAYTGNLVNGLDVALSNPSVSVFPVNRVGRPLGVATGRGTTEVPPGGSWNFKTNPVREPGVDQLALPAGALAH